jgi:Mn2+/Fe2+ NRAMP family transporter
MLGPGFMVAATGVGAGDLATGAFAGSHLGTAILWAVLLGAGMKFLLSVCFTRYQLITGKTVLEGSMDRWHTFMKFAFPFYLIPWSLVVGAALISACAITLNAIFPLFDEPLYAKLFYGGIHSLIGLALVRFGGYRLIGKIMKLFILIMFVTVLVCTVMVGPDWLAIIEGMFIPRIPKLGENGLAWTVALTGGVGGTLTIICYGYWIREEGRVNESEIKKCRWDLFAAYFATALFGMAMVIIGSRIQVSGSGAKLIASLGHCFGEEVNPVARWMFLIGAWAAVFSSLLGVWQSVPYIFADFYGKCRRSKDINAIVKEQSRPYRWYLYALAVVPMFFVPFGFKAVQMLYAIVGACFMPLLALGLIFLLGKGEMKEKASGWLVRGALVAILIFFAGFGIKTAHKKLTGKKKIIKTLIKTNGNLIK